MSSNLVSNRFPDGINLGMFQVETPTTKGFKHPMLIVGANNYMRQHLPFVVIQNYDTHLFFTPTSQYVYQISAVLCSRTVNAKPIIYTSYNRDINDCMLDLFQHIKNNYNTLNEVIDKRKILWLTNSIYRCHKISLKDVLHLESYKKGA